MNSNGATPIFPTPVAQAGDITTWTHPWPFTITHTISNAKRITAIKNSWYDSAHPQYIAQSIKYTAFGAPSTLQNGCAGSGCTGAQETYDYNKRLQPVRIQLGTATNNSADNCLVYNYYGGTNPSSCQVPTPGSSGNNGNVNGYWYNDNFTIGYSHTAAFYYDNVNRLTSGVATGNFAYNYTYDYTHDGSTGQYGNMHCTTTQGQCNSTLSFDASTNRLKTSLGFAYDAAGNLTTDVTGVTKRNYAWDAEGRLTQVTDNGGNTTTSYAYNALGQKAEISTTNWQLEGLYDPQGARRNGVRNV